MKKWSLWILIVATVLFLYLTRGVLLPFMFGLAVAYFLDPVTDKLEEWRIPRAPAAGLVICLFFTLIVGVFVALWPILKNQLGAIVETLPRILSGLRPWLEESLKSFSDSMQLDLDGADTDGMLSGLVQEGLTRLNAAASGLLKSGLAVFNILTLALISPVVAFYLLRDWDKLVAKVNSWLPSNGGAEIRDQAKQIDTALAGFVRGQIIVCTVMGLIYAVGWSLAGLNFALILGVLAGIMAFVPFIGAIFAAVIALLIGFEQWGFGIELLPVVGVYVFVQIVESAWLTPRLVGDRVGLHPVWVLFAVFAGSEVMGFVGILIAVPAAAALAVMVRFWIDQYLDHYQDKDPGAADEILTDQMDLAIKGEAEPDTKNDKGSASSAAETA